MTTNPLPERIAAVLLILLAVLTALFEWGVAGLDVARGVLAIAVIGLLSLRVKASRVAFVAVGAGLTIWEYLINPDWDDLMWRGLASAAFIGSFFTALTTLRNVAQTSPAIRRSGRYLASQPPGRRYAALSVGGHLFGLLLSYGAISLLGGMATASAQSEPDAIVRGHRVRRMLLAIQRGFLSTLPWSPMGFAMAVTTTQIPGASWADAVWPGVATSLIMLTIGWALDSIFKPRLGRPTPRKPVDGTWRLMAPLFLLLGLLAASVGVLHELYGVRIAGIVIVVVPVLSLTWAVIQSFGRAEGSALDARARGYLFGDLPSYRGEIVLLMMAGYIGTLGAPVLVPLMTGAGLDLASQPAWLVLLILVWIVPVLGQFGMNPILAVTLIAPLIPEAAALGVSPTAIVTAIIAGWTISGVCSPFTATTLMVGSLGGISAFRVGVKWNGGYLAVLLPVLSLWALIYAFVIG